MTRVSSQVRINAPKGEVWEALADFGGIYKWNPGVSHSYITSGNAQDRGATRHCDLPSPSGAYLKERIVEWRDGEYLKVEIFETNLPLKQNIVEFSVEADGDGAIVKVTPDYTLKYGPLGSLMDALWARRKIQKGFNDLLAGLKYHVETGETVTDRVPNSGA